jgi:uncharacterized protein (TIGR01777 family)
MKIVIAGGSGFLGAPLAEVYAEEGHEVIVLTRSLPSGEARHDPGTGVPGITRLGWVPDGRIGPWANSVERTDAVINLSGEAIDKGRWTPQRKAQLRDSRILATRSLAASVLAAAVPPRAFVSGSAVGYYGDTGDAPVTEASAAGQDFLAHLCEDWEAEAHRAESSGARVAVVRTGVVLDRSGGALPRMMLPFKFFAGGPLGAGRQYVSWIQRLDWVELVRWVVQTPDAAGAINATAPAPVTSRELARAIGRAMHRPSLLPVPPIALKIAVGGLAESLLGGQRVLPTRPLALGYHFRYPDIDQAFRGMFGL